MTQDGPRHSLILAGAGLASAIIATRLSRLPAPPDILILEAASEPFGEHTWSFHLSDVETQSLSWLDPMIACRWPSQSVRFPSHRRTLTSAYASLTSASVAAALSGLPNVTLRLRAEVEALAPHGARLTNGEFIEADCVIDARGYAPSASLGLGYQKFMGLEVETRDPHGLDAPVIMDASVDQLDGYRFLYLLPFSATRLLIEDTRYSDSPDLDTDALRSSIRAYAAQNDWLIKSVVREEQGVLPITLAFDAGRFWSERPRDVPQAGLRAGLFHPVTGYSLPDAVRVADLIAGLWPIGSAALAARIRSHALTQSKQQGFYRLLNRMLFRAAEPHERRKVLERFYRLPQDLIERFYAGRTSGADMVRILAGKPPVPLHRAALCLNESAFLQPETA